MHLVRIALCEQSNCEARNRLFNKKDLTEENFIATLNKTVHFCYGRQNNFSMTKST